MVEKTKGCEELRKFIIGILIGASLSFAVSAHAAVENLIGRAVEGVFPVKVNGSQIEKQAIVIDGTSYLPVRAIGDALGMDVSFDADLGVGLTQKAGAKMAIQPTNGPIKMSPKRTTKVKTNIDEPVLKENGDFGLIEADGNQYVPVGSLSNPYEINWNQPQLTIHKKDSPDIIITVSDTYSPNVDGFVFEGYSYVKLSLFGLIAQVNADTLQIDKQ